MTTMVPFPTQGAATTIYREALAFMQHLYDEIRAGRPMPGVAVLAQVDRLLAALPAEARVLVGLTAQMPTTEPLAAHAVNTCILVAATCRGLGFEAAQIREGATAALLHDVGLVKLVDGGSEPANYKTMKHHSYQTLELLDQIPELSRITLYLAPVAAPAHEQPNQPAVLLHHEGQRTGREEELGKIIRLADLYEALTHPRADGTPVAFAAIRTMLTTQKLFEPRLMKAFFDQVGMYPVGSWVLLSTGEVGLVIGVQPGLPLRPHVGVFYDSNGRRLPETRMVELNEHPTVFIKQSLDGEPQPRS